MKVVTQLIKIVGQTKGKMLGFGLTDDKLLDAILKNEKLKCDLLNLKGSSDDTSEEGKNLKDISIEKIRKKFPKKSMNLILANGKEVQHFFSRFIKDSIYLTKGEVCLFFNEETDLSKILRRYQKYQTKIEQIFLQDGIILRIDCAKAKSSKWLDFKGNLLATFEEGIDLITEIIST